MSESLFVVPSTVLLFCLLQDILIFYFLGFQQDTGGADVTKFFARPPLSSLFYYMLMSHYFDEQAGGHILMKSTCEVSGISHVCFHLIIECFFFFTFEHYSLPYNDFHVSKSRHRKTLPGLGKDDEC